MFKKAYQKTNLLEGGYVNNPLDVGGETYKGISRRYHPDWKGWRIIDNYKKHPQFPHVLSSLSDLKAFHESFFKKHFWEACGLNHISDQLFALKIYDMAVNLGVKTAVRLFQRAINFCNRNQRDFLDITVDGVIGGQTSKAFNSVKEKEVLFKILDTMQGYHYIRITESNKNNEIFIAGWFKNRIR